MGATCNARNMLRGTTLCVGEKFVRASPQVNAIDIRVARKVGHQLRASSGENVDHAGWYVAHGERLRKRHGWEWCPFARQEDRDVAPSQYTGESQRLPPLPSAQGS
jgi:hypothetical protein